MSKLGHLQTEELLLELNRRGYLQTEELLLELNRRGYNAPFPRDYQKYALRAIDAVVEERQLWYRVASLDPRTDPFLKPIFELRDWISTNADKHLKRLRNWTYLESDFEVDEKT